MKIIFFGSDDFASVHLEALLKDGREISACVVPPDKPKGRGLHTAVSPVKAAAERHRLPVVQPESLKEAAVVQALKDFSSDLFVVIAYGKILPENILAIPRLGAINVHASLLPKYRGAAPIHWAVINGDLETGVSVIRMNPFLDAGDILGVLKMPIAPSDTSLALRARMMQAGQGLLLLVIEELEKGIAPSRVQDPASVTFAPKLTKAMGHIDWHRGAVEIHNSARGLLPWPAAYTFYSGKLLKILETEVVSSTENAMRPGQVVEICRDGFVVQTGCGGLLVKKVHLESAKAMGAQDFIKGRRILRGFVFDAQIKQL